MYSPGNKARDSLARGKNYFEPLDTDTGYWSTWSAILALSDADFGTGLNNGGMTTNVGYDRYGRAGFALRATYSLTPALAFYGTVSPMWTAEKVDTDTGVAGANRTIVNDQSFVKGDSNYIGTEFNVGMGWKFAPNASFDMIGAWLNAGSALDTAELRRRCRRIASTRRMRTRSPRGCGCPSSSCCSSVSVVAGHGWQHRPCPVCFPFP